MSFSPKLLRVIIAITGLLCIHSVLAINSVDYQIDSAGFPAQTTIGNHYSIIYTITNNVPINHPITIKTSHTVTGAQFTFNDACNGTPLNRGANCQITVTFIPTLGTVSPATVQVLYGYGNTTITTPILSTTVNVPPAGNITGVVTQGLPSPMHVGTGYPVGFTFINNGNANVTNGTTALTGQTSNLHNVTYSAGCTSPLVPSNSCVVSGTFIPEASGDAAIGVTYSYGGNAVPLTTTGLVENTGGDCLEVDGSTALLLPTNIYQYGDNVVKFVFTNNCDNSAATLGTVNITATLNGSATTVLTPGTPGTTTDTCSGQTLAANTFCSVIASIEPQTTGSNLVMTATVNYSAATQLHSKKRSKKQLRATQQATATTSAAAVLANDNTDRMVTLVNQCSYPVWVSFQPGSVPNNTGSGSPYPTTCTTNADCPANSTCNNSTGDANAGNCFWSNPTLDGNHPNGELVAAQPNAVPDTMNVIIPETNGITNPPNGDTRPTARSPALYNAGIEARTGCTGSGTGDGITTGVVCAVNSCETGSDGMCAPGNGSIGPAAYNAAEFTFIRSAGTDGTGVEGVLDLQVIDGLNVPIEMKGRGAPTTGDAPYNNCTGVGLPIQPITGSATTQLGNCSFNLSPSDDATNYRYVITSGSSSNAPLCDADTDCNGTDICGLGYYPVGNVIDKVCGPLAGYVSPNKGVCSQYNLLGTDKHGDNLQTTLYSNTFHCDANYNTNSVSYTGQNLYACTTPPLNTCYAGDAHHAPNNPCCGCVDWWNQTSPANNLPVPTNTESCSKYTSPNNTNWQSLVQPKLQWLKGACPTAYVYQYDDKSSSFICTVKGTTTTQITNPIVTNYQVTFCPGGEGLQMS